MINYSIAIMGTKPGTLKANITETKAYGVAQIKERISLSDFAKHIHDHGCAYSKGDIVSILTTAVSCLRELMLEGKRVKLGDLGDFQPRLQTEGAVTTEDFSAKNIKAVNVSWTPGKDFEDLRNDATFQLVPKRSQQEDAIEVIKNTDTIHGLE
ncbi:MAG: DNA-binding protein [Bacteroidaceae bacterium]|nr:DNA-binding protein [Bacteroidaceae bacterium]